MTTPAQIDEAVTIITDVISVASLANPNPVVGVAATLLTDFIQAWAANLKGGIAAGEIIDDGRGGFVTKTWANDPRHAIGPDGNFVDKSL